MYLYPFTFKRAVKEISTKVCMPLTKASRMMGRSSNFVSSKIQHPSVRLNTAIAIAHAFKYELVLMPSADPIPSRALVLEETPEDGEAID